MALEHLKIRQTRSPIEEDSLPFLADKWSALEEMEILDNIELRPCQ